LSKALKNSYVQTAILAVILFGGVFGFWLVVRAALRTEYPLLAVASGSMIGPYGLNVGDLIVVQGGFSGAEIAVGQPPNGTMIVFYNPHYPRVGGLLFFAENKELIVHRAIYKENFNGTWYFQTKGDNNYGPDPWSGPDTYEGMISSKLVVGKVVAVVPWIGNVPLFIRTPEGLALIVLLFILILLIEFIPVLWKQLGQERKLPTD